MSYEAEYRDFLQQALEMLGARLKQGYNVDFTLDEIIEFKDQGWETFQRPRARFYLLVRQLSDSIVSAPSAEHLTNLLLKDDRFLQRMDIRTTEGQRVSDENVLRNWIKQIYLHGFVERYISLYESEARFPVHVDNDKFIKLYTELMASLDESVVTSVVVCPLWNFSSELDEIAFDSKTRIRLLTSEERASLYELIKFAGSFPLLGLHNIRHGIEVSTDVVLPETNSTLHEELINNTIDALRLLKSGGVQAPLRLNTIEPPNRWRKILTGNTWGPTTVTQLHSNYSLTTADITNLTRMWNRLHGDEVKSSEIVERVRARMRHLYTSVDDTDRLVDSLIILESIFLDDSDTTEITYKLSSRAAVFLADELGERKQTKALIQKLYNLRSKLVHGSKILPKHLRFEGEAFTVRHFSDQAEAIARTAVVKLIETDELLRDHDGRYFDDLLLS